MSEAAYRVNALSAVLGAEVVGVDVTAARFVDDFELLQARLHEHQLLAFRDQTLTPADLVAFTRRFGAPEPHVLQHWSLPGFPEIYVLSNIVENGRQIGSTEEGLGWHTDLTYMPYPAGYTILYALEVPVAGGDTLFASLYRAYDTLAEDERKRLRPLTGRFHYEKYYNRRKNMPPLTDEQKARTPVVEHPLVRIHPFTGREGMYVNRSDCIGVIGMDDAEGVALVERMFEYTLDARFQYAHRWKRGDLVIWDNRGLLHRATPYDLERERRCVWRTSVRGEKPIGYASRRQGAAATAD
ncbi:MAG TPA: TauD/TfdA family dioxygenase [Burkholderiales bacterium]|nr:TauD/TfdA family dioxygenase [Burkholderiales bacterium]